MSEKRMRPAPLLFEPAAPEEPVERFFGLEEIVDPAELLTRAGELATAFRAAAERAANYQAMAAAELADPARFDRLTTAEVAERVGVSESTAEAMISTGRRLLAQGFSADV